MYVERESLANVFHTLYNNTLAEVFQVKAFLFSANYIEIF